MREKILTMMIKYRYVYLVLSFFVLVGFLINVPTIMRDLHRYKSLTIKDVYCFGRLLVVAYFLSTYFNLTKRSKLGN